MDEFLDLKEGEKPCSFGVYFQSIIAWGKTRTVEEKEEKKEVLVRLMTKYVKTRRKWTFEDEELDRVMVVEITIEKMTGKSCLP